MNKLNSINSESKAGISRRWNSESSRPKYSANQCKTVWCLHAHCKFKTLSQQVDSIFATCFGIVNICDICLAKDDIHRQKLEWYEEDAGLLFYLQYTSYIDFYHQLVYMIYEFYFYWQIWSLKALLLDFSILLTFTALYTNLLRLVEDMARLRM